jgi:hypothetical protein
MSLMRDYLSNPHWNATYRYALSGAADRNFGKWAYDEGGYYPIFTDANSLYSVQMKRSGFGAAQYNLSAVAPEYRGLNKQLKACSNYTGSPDGCSQVIFKQ